MPCYVCRGEPWLVLGGLQAGPWLVLLMAWLTASFPENPQPLTTCDLPPTPCVHHMIRSGVCLPALPGVL
jgi:hypothetical protein